VSSILKVDNLQTGAGATHSISSLGITSPGTVLQDICGICDGRTVSGITFPNVTGTQALTTSHADVTGSSISYTPPAGTTTVIYTFSFHWESTVTSGISHYEFYIDGTPVNNGYGRRTQAGAYQGNHHNVSRVVYEFPILIDSTLDSDEITNLKLKSWTGARTLKMTGRYYGSSYNAVLHHNVWWDGASASGSDGPPATLLALPTLSIKAIA
tara:strand:- start:18 stop:653 length:636 start_codon:yes stop_codon:yes gene_type:complete